MDVFLVGSLAATALVMLGTLVDEFAQKMRNYRGFLTVRMPDEEAERSRDLEDGLSYHEAA
jgi:hypothetical protein